MDKYFTTDNYSNEFTFSNSTNYDTNSNNWIWFSNKGNKMKTDTKNLLSTNLVAWWKLDEHKSWWKFNIYYPLKRQWDFIVDIPSVIKQFIQRGVRGWGDRDVWSVDYYLADVVPQMLRRLKKTKHGIPNSVFEYDKNGKEKTSMKVAAKRWNKILDKIIKTFETAKDIQESEWFYQPSKDWTRKQYNRYIKLAKGFRRDKLAPKAHAMTLTECKEFEEGFKLFATHFFSLWD